MSGGETKVEGRTTMPRYMTQFSYTKEAWAALTKNPEDRTGGLRDLIETAGGRLISLDYTMGDYDGVAISEAPDDTSYAAVIAAVLVPGHVAKIKSTKLMPAADMVEAWQKANAWTYRGPEQ
jgi:uncharacterized protein with GYD domain